MERGRDENGRNMFPCNGAINDSFAGPAINNIIIAIVAKENLVPMIKKKTYTVRCQLCLHFVNVVNIIL
jgi:hypothetical protein